MMPVEVKVSGTEEEARVQIGIWLSAWHERVAQLDRDRTTRVITLPIIIVQNHRWDLYFAVDKGSHIDILQFTKHRRYFIGRYGISHTSCAAALGGMGIVDF